MKDFASEDSVSKYYGDQTSGLKQVGKNSDLEEGNNKRETTVENFKHNDHPNMVSVKKNFFFF